MRQRARRDEHEHEERARPAQKRAAQRAAGALDGLGKGRHRKRHVSRNTKVESVCLPVLVCVGCACRFDALTV